MSNIEITNGQSLTTKSEKSGSPSALPFDAANYRAEVDAFDITEQQKQELLLTLWSIMRSFVELGFSVDVCAALLGDIDLSIPDIDELK